MYLGSVAIQKSYEYKPPIVSDTTIMLLVFFGIGCISFGIFKFLQRKSKNINYVLFIFQSHILYG